VKGRQSKCGVLFVDIADSSRLYRMLGDEAARHLVAQSLRRFEEVVVKHGGTVVDRIGDELMCTFADPIAMVTAAAELQRGARDLGRGPVEPSELSVRIGLHFGPVIEEGSRVFGATVYTAKRTASLAKAGQILVTGDTVALLGSDRGFTLRHADRVVIKGMGGEQDLYDVIWDPLLQTVQRLDITEQANWGVEVSLRHANTAIVLGGGVLAVTIGRGATCDLVIADRDVSWLHARIECGKGHASLTDVSTNGTYVAADGSSEATLVHRDVIELAGAGLLGCGRAPHKGDATAIEFSCRALL